MADMVFISFYHNDDCVGAQRGRFLSSFLEHEGYKVTVVSRDTFGSISNKLKIVWLLRLFFFLLKSKVKNIYATVGPFWFLPIVYISAKLRGSRVIYDFRDPWSYDMGSGYGGTKKKRSEFRVRISRYIENLCYKQCKYFFVCTSGMYDIYKEQFGGDEKLKLVLNGYESSVNDVFCNIDDLKNNHAIKIVCLGRLLVHGKSKIENVLDEIKQFVNKNNLDVMMVFVGSENEELVSLTKKIGLYKKSKFFDSMSHQQALSIAACCDIGLCTVRDENLMYGTKIFDYIGLGLPVLDTFDHEKRLFEFFNDYIIRANMISGASKYVPPIECSREYIFKNALQYFQ